MKFSMISQFIPGLIKSVAEGDPNKTSTKIYWAIAGKKTLIAGLITLFYAFAWGVVGFFDSCAPECATVESVVQAEQFLSYIPNVIAILVAAGLVDASVRMDPPKKR